MNEPIFARALMRKRGADARAAGRGRDDHEMNHGASAIMDWQKGWDEALLTGEVALIINEVAA